MATVFVFTTLFLASIAAQAAGVIQLPRTGQVVAYASGDDGDLQAGVPWPSPRFTDLGDGTVTDHLTGLGWAKDANVMVARDPAFDSNGARDGKVLWSRALEYVDRLNAECFLGHRDWRLPNIRELASLIDHRRANPCLPAGHPFANVQPAYFSSTSDELRSVWGVRFHTLHSNARSGEISDFTAKRTDPYPVWPVRTVGGGAVTLPQTGQTRCWHPGDDGDLRSGVALLTPRFADLGDGTVRDRLTGLMWPRDVAAITGLAAWEEVPARLAQINTTNYLGYGDWRLPNRWEAWSLIDFGQSIPAIQMGHPFVRFDEMEFWTATTDASATNKVYLGDLTLGGSDASEKSSFLSSFVPLWPVRSAPAALAGGRIEGRASSAEGPLARVQVRLEGPVQGSVFTEANGRFAFTDLPDGQYILAVAKLHYAFAPAQHIVQLQGAGAAPLTFTGTLTNSLGWMDWSDRVSQFYADLSEVQFVSREEGWITSSSVAEIYHTTDGGRSWEVQTTALPCNAIHMRNALEGYAGGQSGFIYRTTNGGLNWKFIGTMGQTISDIEFPPVGEVGYACGLNGSVARITGAQVQRINIGGFVSDMHSISFPVDGSEGWIAGSELIVHWVEGEWRTDQWHTTGSGDDLEFVDVRNGWRVGSAISSEQPHTIIHTRDGLHWEVQWPPAGFNAAPTSVDFVDLNEGWVVGAEGLILHTTNGGGYRDQGTQTWTNGWVAQAPGLTRAYLTSVCAVDREVVYAVGNGGTFLKYARPGSPTEPVRFTRASVARPCADLVITLEWQPPLSAAAVETTTDLQSWVPTAENVQGGRWIGPAPADIRHTFYRLRLPANP